MIQTDRKMWLLIIGVVITVIVALTIWYLQQRTVVNQHAAAASRLSFVPLTQAISSGDQLSADLTIDPGTNQVSVIQLAITYDSSQLQISSANNGLGVNPSILPQILAAPAISCNGNNCILTATYSVGSNPLNAITTKTTFATFHATVIASNGTPITVGFGQTTAVFSIAPSDQANENVLSSKQPLSFTVGSTGTSCIANQSTCSWDAVSGAVSYHYQISQQSSGTVIQQGDVNASQTSVTFVSAPGNAYTCTVDAVNACGTGTSGAGTSSCPALTATTTPTFTPTPTITPSETPTVTPTSSLTPTSSPTPTSCSGPGTVSNLRIVCPNCNN